MYLLRWPYVFLFYFVKILNYIILFQMLNQPSIPGINLVIMYYFFTIVIQFAKMCLEFLHPLSWGISIYVFLCLQYSSQISVVVLFIYLFFFFSFLLAAPYGVPRPGIKLVTRRSQDATHPTAPQQELLFSDFSIK